MTEDSTHKNPKRLLIENGDTNQPLAYEYSANTTTFQTNYEIEQLTKKKEKINIILNKYNKILYN